MAALGEVPFGRYYGSVDATPLFVVLAGAYQQRTGDLDFVERSGPTSSAPWPGSTTTATTTATASSSTRGAAANGLANQGWKDSDDADVPRRRHAGRGAHRALRGPGLRLRRPPRGGAPRPAARARRAGRRTASARPRSCGERFERGVLVRGDLAPTRWRWTARSAAATCGARTPATRLFAGIATPDRAGAWPQTLLDEPSFSGWGMRTLAAGEAATTRCRTTTARSGRTTTP